MAHFLLRTDGQFWEAPFAVSIPFNFSTSPLHGWRIAEKAKSGGVKVSQEEPFHG